MQELVDKTLRYKYKTQPFSHQKRALSKILKLNGRAGLFMEMGSGKTKIAIDWASICYENYELKRVLVVAPISVMSVWKRQIQQHSPVAARIAVLSGPTAGRVSVLNLMMRTPYSKGIEWVITNYEGIWRTDSRGKKLEDYIKQWQPDLIIADESHKIKHPTSKQSKSMSRLGDTVPMALALSGTPVTKSPLDVYGQFRFFNPTVFGTRWGSFKAFYGVWGGMGGYQLRRVQNIQDLIKKVRRNSFQIKKSQCLDLPPKIGDISDPAGPNIIPVELPEKTMRYYREMREQMITEIEDSKVTAEIALVKMLRLSQITSGFTKDVDKNVIEFDTSKHDVAMDLIMDMVEQDEKVVVFTRFVHDYTRLCESLIRRKVSHSLLAGRTPHDQREGLVHAFQNDPRRLVFVSQISSGSLGIELFAASQTVFYSWDYRWDSYVQATDRTHRQGQINPCNYYHLVVPKTIDQLSLRVLQEKGNLAEAIVHDVNILRQV